MCFNNYILSKVFLFVCIPPNHYTQSYLTIHCNEKYYMLLYNIVQKGGLLVEESEIYKKLNKDIKELEEELKDAKSKK